MKKIYEKWNSFPLIARIAVFLVIGALLGIFVPQATFMKIFGNVFVGALKAIAPILVFVLVVSSLANAGKGVGKQFSTVIILYLASTLLASFVAVLASYAFPVTLKLTEAANNTAPSGIGEVLMTLINNMVQNPISAMINSNYIGILTWAVIFGLAMKKIASPATKEMLTNLSDGVSHVVRFIISFAPFGIMGLVFNSVSTNGLSIFVDYGKLLAVLVGCMLFTALVINPIIIFICIKKNPYPLVFKCLKES